MGDRVKLSTMKKQIVNYILSIGGQANYSGKTGIMYVNNEDIKDHALNKFGELFGASIPFKIAAVEDVAPLFRGRRGKATRLENYEKSLI